MSSALMKIDSHKNQKDEQTQEMKGFRMNIKGKSKPEINERDFEILCIKSQLI